MILLIDNYDSFSYNLYQLAGSVRPDIKVIRNDQMTAEEIGKMKPEAIILSPGPGRPEDAGCCMEVAKTLGKRIPILGICLGHQAICQAFGGNISYAKKLMHGKQSNVKILETEGKRSRIFHGMEEEFPAARYHSLAAEEESLPEELSITARSEDGEIMAVEHKTDPIYGLQFHPESILTPDGMTMIKNFLEVAEHD